MAIQYPSTAIEYSGVVNFTIDIVELKLIDMDCNLCPVCSTSDKCVLFPSWKNDERMLFLFSNYHGDVRQFFCWVAFVNENFV